MNKVLLIAFSLFGIISNALAQNNKLYGHCKQLPMQDGDITYIADTLKIQPANSFVISSTKDEVYALALGKVVAIVRFPGKDYKAVGITYTRDTLIEYTMLAAVSVQEGDDVDKGDVVGKATLNEKTGKNEAAIEIKLPLKHKKLVNPAVMSFIERIDK